MIMNKDIYKYEITLNNNTELEKVYLVTNKYIEKAWIYELYGWSRVIDVKVEMEELSFNK
jgi:hypothetical protein